MCPFFESFFNFFIFFVFFGGGVSVRAYAFLLPTLTSQITYFLSVLSVNKKRRGGVKMGYNIALVHN